MQHGLIILGHMGLIQPLRLAATLLGPIAVATGVGVLLLLAVLEELLNEVEFVTTILKRQRWLMHVLDHLKPSSHLLRSQF